MELNANDDCGRSIWSNWANLVYQVLTAAILTTLLVLLCWRPLVAYDDFWVHAAVGRWMWQHGEVPKQTLFLWTASIPYVYHSWLAELGLYGLTNLGEPESAAAIVRTFATGIVWICYALAWWVWRRCGRLSIWYVIGFVLAIEGSYHRFQVRPEMFTSLFLCGLLGFLIHWSGPWTAGTEPSGARWTRSILAVFLAFVLWANLHGAVVLGVLLLGLTVCCDMLQDRFDWRSRALLVIAVAAPFAICVNPYGLGYWKAYGAISGDVYAEIVEWAPIWHPEFPIRKSILIRSGLLFTLAFSAWAANKQRRWAHLAWLLVFLVSFVQARRNLWPFTIVCLMVLAANAASLDPIPMWRKLKRRMGSLVTDQDDRLPTLLRWALRSAVVVWLGLECFSIGLHLQWWRPMYPARLEQGVVRFLEEQQLTGRMFHDSEIAGYLEWRLAGNPPLYIDAINAYPIDVMRDYVAILDSSERSRMLLDEQQIEIVVLTTNRGRSVRSLAPLADMLDEDPRWCRVHVSRGGAVWVRRNAKFQAVWESRRDSVNPVSFRLLETHGDENEIIVPPVLADDLSPRTKVKP